MVFDKTLSKGHLNGKNKQKSSAWQWDYTQKNPWSNLAHN
jgi:hypothetical protein